MSTLGKPIDIFIVTYQRQEFTKECLEYLKSRTNTPYRLFIIDNGGNEYLKDCPDVFLYIGLSQNIGIHGAWNIALSLAESEYFITSDNDILVPDLREYDRFWSRGEGELPNNNPDWLERLIKLLDERPDYGAISLHPHIFIGAAGIDPEDPEDVKERNMCGGVMRIMRTEVVRQVGGWEHKIDGKRNHEERTICSRLQSAGYKVGICSRIRAYHNFGENWGYKEIPPEVHGHTPELKDYVTSFDHREGYDLKTWLPK